MLHLHVLVSKYIHVNSLYDIPQENSFSFHSKEAEVIFCPRQISDLHFSAIATGLNESFTCSFCFL